MRCTRSTRTRHTARRWKFTWSSLIIALLALSGLGLLLYPTVSSWFTQYDQSRSLANAMASLREGDTDPPSSEQIARAHEYNEHLTPGALYEANGNAPTGTGQASEGQLDYWSLLVGPNNIMARIQVPSISVDLPVYHGTSDATLLKGVGHLEGTSLPVGGAGTHTVLTGHRGLASATMFTDLNKVKTGDTFTITVLDQPITYRVFDIRVVEPTETESLLPQEGRDLATLVTCTPLGINSQRIFVTGERVIPTPEDDADAALADPNIPSFPWWSLGAVAGLIVIGVFVWRSGYTTTEAHDTTDTVEA